MEPEIAAFARSFALTAAGIAVTGTLGLRRRRRPHLALAAATTVSLVVTVIRAELLGRAFSFSCVALGVHLVFANLAALAFLAVVAVGSRLWRREGPDCRLLHRRLALAFVILVACATVTGTYMLAGSVRRTPGAAACN